MRTDARTSHSNNSRWLTIDPHSQLAKVTEPFEVKGRTTWYVKLSSRSSANGSWRHLKKTTGVPIGARNSKAQARTEALRILSSFQQENDPRTPLRLDAFFSAYFRDREKDAMSRSYRSQLKSAATAFERHLGGTTLITQISAPSIRAFFADQKSAYMALSHYRCLRTMFKQAVIDGTLDTNPLNRFDPRSLHKRLRPRPRGIISPQQILQICDALPKSNYHDRLVSALVLFLFATGLRRSEACYLKRGSIDEANNVLYIVRSKEYRLKTQSSEGAIPLNELAKAALREQSANRDAHECPNVRNSEWIFCNLKGDHYHPDTLTKNVHARIVAACASLGIPTDGIDLHSFRHSLSQHLIDAGAEAAVVSKYIRHASLATTLSMYHRNADISTKFESVQRLLNAIPLRGTASILFVLDTSVMFALRMDLDQPGGYAERNGR